MNRLVIQRISAISIGITQPLKFRSGPNYLVGTSFSDFKSLQLTLASVPMILKSPNRGGITNTGQRPVFKATGIPEAPKRAKATTIPK